MVNPSTGEWSAPPPSYDCIVGNNNMSGGVDDDIIGNKTNLKIKPNRFGGTYTMKQYMTIRQGEVDDDMSLDMDDKKLKLKTEPLGMIYSISQLEQFAS